MLLSGGGAGECSEGVGVIHKNDGAFGHYYSKMDELDLPNLI